VILPDFSKSSFLRKMISNIHRCFSFKLKKKKLCSIFFKKGTQYFITIIDVKGMDFDYEKLDQYILTALLQCKELEKGQYKQEANLKTS
jgi:hypothetical protein